MSAVVFLTGATGFVGTQVARWILERTQYSMIVLVRADDEEAAERRLARAWWDWPELVAAIGQRIRVVPGDLAEPGLGLDPATYADLARQITHVVHMAADFRIDAPIGELRDANVLGTANTLDLARAAHQAHGLERFSHVSTAYVAGLREGVVSENSLTDEHGFATGYEETKYQAERLVHEASEELPISVFRPGLIVGDSQTGAIKTFNTLYVPLRWYLAGQLRVVPASPSLRVNLVPVDYVASAVARLTFDERAAGLTFHLTAPSEALPTVGELLDFAREWAAEHLGMRLPRPLFVPASPKAIRTGCRALQSLGAGRGGTLRALGSLAPYFAERRVYRRDNVDRLLGSYDVNWRDLLPRLLEYAVYYGFLHRSERTVHEQVLFRLQSRRR